VSPHPSIPVSQYPYIPHPCAFAVELRQTKGTGRKWGLGNGELCLDYAYAVLSSGSFRLWDLSWGGEMGSRKESATHMHGNRSSWRMETGERRKENVEWRTENGEDLEWQDKNEKGQTQNVNGLFTK